MRAMFVVLCAAALRPSEVGRQSFVALGMRDEGQECLLQRRLRGGYSVLARLEQYIGWSCSNFGVELVLESRRQEESCSVRCQYQAELGGCKLQQVSPL